MTAKELKNMLENVPDDYKICVLTTRHSQFDGSETIVVEARSADMSFSKKEICIS